MPQTLDLKLPAFLNIPDKLKVIIPNYNDYDYFLIDGGRASAKSQSVVRFVLYLGDVIPELRIFFGREIQNTIEESVYQLAKDLITDHNLAYNVMAQKIDHRINKSMLRFRGFRDKGKINIKGLEGVDILVIDEAQAISAETLKIIIPTIRKAGSKIFFMMNRTLKDDPVFVDMVGRKNCLHVHIDYFENPHCPVKAMAEAEQCRQRNIEDYRHIWLGEPLDQANRAVFRGVQKIVGEYAHPIDPIRGHDYTLGIDLARSVDYTVFTVFDIQERRVAYWERLENENRTSWNYQEEKASAIALRYNNALLVPDSTGVGDPLVERWFRRGLRVYHQQTAKGHETPGVKFTSVNKENLIEKLKIAIELGLFSIPRIKILIDELEAFEATILPSRTYRYAAPGGMTDDCVISLALAVWGVQSEIYEKWQEQKKDDKVNPFWDRVRADMNKNSSDNSLLTSENTVQVSHTDENQEFDDPFED